MDFKIRAAGRTRLKSQRRSPLPSQSFFQLRNTCAEFCREKPHQKGHARSVW